jgi:thiol:disulfide interchange protein
MTRLASLMALLLFPMMVVAQGKATRFSDLAEISAKIEPASGKVGDKVTLTVTVVPNPGAWTYAIIQPDGKSGQGKFVATHPGITFDKAIDPTGWVDELDLGTGDTLRKYKKPVTWEVKGTVTGAVGKANMSWKGSNLQACNKSNCFPATQSNYPELEFEVLPGGTPAVIIPPTPPVTPPVVTPPTTTPTEEGPRGAIKKNALTTSEYKARLDGLLDTLEKKKVEREGGLGTLLATAALWGLISLITPCVFPMIPITVSLFLKQAHQSAMGAIRQALIYCLTITVVLGLSAISLLSVFRQWSVSPVMNIGLGLLFIVFALSLFGLYNLTLPNFLLKYSEGKRKKGGVMGAVFGAVAFSIVSFTCVAPFLGGFAGMASSGNYNQVELVLAGLTFGAAFATPFFVLALFPTLLKKLPKSGGWLDTVKVVMGFLELAAALKFFRTAELRMTSQPGLFTYDLVLTAWVAISVVAGLYLLNTFRLPHDEEKPSIGVLRLLFAIGFLSFAVYLLPGAFKGANGQNQQPRGEVFTWVDAFLLPEPSSETGASNSEELPWGADIGEGLDLSQKSKNGLVFIDFTGVTCSNCKANERGVFTRPEVRDLLKQYQLVQMYTDDVPEVFYKNPPSLDQRRDEGYANLAFQDAAFGTQQLPLYVILQRTPTGAKLVGTYSEGKINKVNEFIDFLKAPLAK